MAYPPTVSDFKARFTRDFGQYGKAGGDHVTDNDIQNTQTWLDTLASSQRKFKRAYHETTFMGATSESTWLAATLAGYTPGKPVNCVENRDLTGPEAYGETTLLFRTGRKLIWRTETSGSCDAIKRGDALITHQYSSRLCQGDIARTADLRAGFQTGSCVIGEFVPYRK